MLRKPFLLAALIFTGTAFWCEAQPVVPAAPKEYTAHIRYRIYAGRNERVRKFYPMIEHLKRLGLDLGPDFEPDTIADDYTGNRLVGTISSANARRLLDDPHVKSLLLLPPGFKLPEPENYDIPVRVQIELTAGLNPAQQRLLFEQVKERLRESFGFKDAIAYDTRGYSRIIGTVFGGELLNLLKDFRGEPAGWLTPLKPVSELPSPLREGSPIRVVEVMPEPDGVVARKELPPAPEIPRALEKLTADVRELQGKEGDATKPTRMEIILVTTPADESTTWEKDLIEAVPQLVVEGRFGPVVAATFPPDKAAAVAALPIVSTVRLPSSGAPVVLPTTDAKGSSRQALDTTGLARLHGLGHRGKGMRVGVIGSDFRGWELAVKGKQLPASTRIFDITRQRNSNIEPDEYPKDDVTVGQGTLAALAVALAAPEADLLLIRVEATAPYMVLAIARHINGEPLRNESLEIRRDELDASFQEMQDRWKKLIIERNEILENFDAGEDTAAKRDAHFAKAKEYKEEEVQYQRRLTRYQQFQRGLRDLAQRQVVVNTLSWPEGYVPNGGNPLAQYMNNRPFRGTWWFQAAGDTRNQVWSGFFRDGDINGVMEFTPPGTPLPRGRWTNELNFLGFQKFDGKVDPELPASARLRISVQWQEAHDPVFLRRGEDLYREPLTKLRLMLLRQRDPSGAKLATDDMEALSASYGLPQRIDNQPSFATYQLSLETTVENAGFYALRVEGQAPTSTRPSNAPTVPGQGKQFDLRLRFLLEVVDAPTRGNGRPVFIDYATSEGTIGMPGDSQSAFTVGAADRLNRQQFYSATGAPFNLELLGKPNLFTYDGLDLAGDGQGIHGSSYAASFAAGLTATALGAGVSPGGFLTLEPAGSLLRIPATAEVRPARK